MTRSVIVTGGAGFIGSHLVDALVERGYHAVVIDNLSSGRRENVHRKAGFMKMDIRGVRMADLFKRLKPAYVFHLAAQLDVRASLQDPIHDARVNIIGSLNVLNACVAAGVKKVIFTSTGGAVYGDTDIIPTPETCGLNPISPYGVAKLAVEKYLHQYKHVHGLKYASLRFSNVYGPRQRPDGEAGVIAIFAGRLARGKMCFINGSGRQTRDFVYVGDVVHAALNAMKLPYTGPVNIATGVETSIQKVHKILAGISGLRQQPKHRPAIAGEQLRSVLDWRLAKKVLRWQPEVSLEEGLRRTVEWHRNHVIPAPYAATPYRSTGQAWQAPAGIQR